MNRVGISLRPYRAGDLDTMYALDVVCFEVPFRFTRGAMRRFAEARKARVVMADDDGTLAGFVIFHVEVVEAQRVAYIVTLDVSPQRRRQGMATQLMEKAETDALGEGCTAVVLHVFTGNASAVRFYAERGFVQAHREEDFYGPAMDAWVFSKPLKHASG